MPLARQANWAAFTSKHVGSGQPSQYGYPVLMGPYHPRYGEDRVGIAVVTPVVHEKASTGATVADAAGGGLNNAVKINISLTNLEHFAAVNEVMASFLQEPYPARACVQVAALPKGVAIEVEAILVI